MSRNGEKNRKKNQKKNRNNRGWGWGGNGKAGRWKTKFARHLFEKLDIFLKEKKSENPDESSSTCLSSFRLLKSWSYPHPTPVYLGYRDARNWLPFQQDVIEVTKTIKLASLELI